MADCVTIVTQHGDGILRNRRKADDACWPPGNGRRAGCRPSPLAASGVLPKVPASIATGGRNGTDVGFRGWLRRVRRRAAALELRHRAQSAAAGAAARDVGREPARRPRDRRRYRPVRPVPEPSARDTLVRHDRLLRRAHDIFHIFRRDHDPHPAPAIRVDVRDRRCASVRLAADDARRHRTRARAVPGRCSLMARSAEGSLRMKGIHLRLYTYENRKHGAALLYEWLLERAREMGVHGGSAFRAIAGFGRHGRLHDQHFFELAGDVPVLVEFVLAEGDPAAAFQPVAVPARGTCPPSRRAPPAGGTDENTWIR